ncbi:hypothetical protein Q4489_07230 [Thalassotalea sp. 1_MG-2023]|uniref:hypothetical protein n=1 Tax=Thalassotalea sp. 1_MG-2023 TaxID=3062680 RepID=UPI0026E1C251|nr:hypothetical protein [Thalassotalea sp. 1_MG-2023]MDO6426799.1 hypothetical protein [Thalassotalea sp. 1_MG-2023]
MSRYNPQQLISNATIGDTVDLKQICRSLNLTLKITPELSDLCRIAVDKEQKVVIQLNASIDKRTKFTFVAIAAAEYLINSARINDTGVTYDIFFLRDIHANRATNLIMLATRLAIPEHIIEKIVDASEVQFVKQPENEKFDIDDYIRQSDYLPDFIRSVIKQSSSSFLVNTVNAR